MLSEIHVLILPLLGVSYLVDTVLIMQLNVLP